MSSSSERSYPANPYPHSHSEKVAQHLKEAIELNQDPEVGKKLKECYRLVAGLDDYLDKNAAEETPLQKKILKDTYNEPWQKDFDEGKAMYNFSVNWATGYIEGQFLKVAAQMTKAKRILEIGMFTGYGAVSMAESALCEEMVCLDIDPFLARFVKDRIAGTPVEHKLEIVLGRAIDSLQILKDQGKQFDLVFIDADKSNYINYYKFIMENDLLDPHGTIMADNTLWSGECYPTPTTPTAKAISDFNALVASDPSVNQVILPLNDGVTLIHKKDLV